MPHVIRPFISLVGIGAINTLFLSGFLASDLLRKLCSFCVRGLASALSFRDLNVVIRGPISWIFDNDVALALIDSLTIFVAFQLIDQQ
jgi:hypothetical protein